MLIEDQSTGCRNCKQPLTWLSHVKRYPQPEAIHEFNFRCESCNRKYQFKEGQLQEKALERNLRHEDEAVRHTELEIGINRRCPDCGGPIKNRHGFALRCDWCYREYSLVDGELQARTLEQELKPTMREFTDALRLWLCALLDPYFGKSCMICSAIFSRLASSLSCFSLSAPRWTCSSIPTGMSGCFLRITRMKSSKRA
jgi:DNA-directed RNA polymerase subunit M/transcription elongation factor TFIIS